MQIYTLASGSDGNSLVILLYNEVILVDCGISCKRVNDSLKNIGLSISDITAIYITHEHSDHIAGLQTLIKKARPNIYANSATCRQLAYRIAGIDPLLKPFESNRIMHFPSYDVISFSNSHDAASPQGYRFDSNGSSFGVLTDSGYVTDNARSVLQGVNLLLLEANHDEAMLMAGNYPYQTKIRILSDHGHLNNYACADFAREMALGGTMKILLGHISKHNNLPSLALNTVQKTLSGMKIEVEIPPYNYMSHVFEV